MKIRLFRVCLICVVVLFLASCSSKTVVITPKKTPPGHEKKVAGNQSAKSHAPGQQKKAAGHQSAKPHAPGQQKKKGH
ncbi:hypothetical protein [Chryseosolibacter indicus]|uniref:Quinol oxidase subunit 4 n=1 Tax=Chryseosolibacter indicus TaxID=2782351 RepID=A0ABS5VTN1_9BACT|nr:hypothetical protein [Chryseosolibacter indicus]MBT1704691.1 hypothetical protein [Chryseosolibacter indicus]